MSRSSVEAQPLLRISKDGPVALVALDNPPVNVLSRAVLDAIAGTFREIEADPTVRAVVLYSLCEKAFAAGASIREMAQLSPREARVHGGKGQAVTTLIEDASVPVVAAVHGTCVGGGLEIVLACDFVVASEDALFGQPEIRLGVMPGWGGTVRLPERIGVAAARDWIYSGRTIPAGEATKVGLVDRLVPRTELLEAAKSWATELASQPAQALATARKAVRHSVSERRTALLQFERQLWSELFGSSDQREGMEAFLTKRPPRFSQARAVVRASPRGARTPARVRRRRSVGKPDR